MCMHAHPRAKNQMTSLMNCVEHSKNSNHSFSNTAKREKGLRDKPNSAFEGQNCLDRKGHRKKGKLQATIPDKCRCKTQKLNPVKMKPTVNQTARTSEQELSVTGKDGSR